MTRKALGRGLGALISDRPIHPDKEQLLDLDIEQIRPSRFQPRTNFDNKALDDLAASIKTNGIIQPIVVRRVDDHYELIAGERRWRAAQRAGIYKIPTIVREVPEDRLLEIALIENIQREELNPIEEARAYRRLTQDLQLTQEEVATRVGKERSSVTNYLRLLKLSNEIQQWVEEEKLSMGHARALLGVNSAEDQIRLASNIIERDLSVRETERSVKRLSQLKDEKSSVIASVGAKAPNDPNVKAAEDKLCQHLATKVRIVRSGDKGKIEIDFYSNLDLDRIYSLLLGKK
ncbi:MAG TPA: ParB/RepB/Spo0J family partition protein [Blastocatellia bacterium]|nr:ParB/RepB/Spo0J family partition protein [Blastocatellia bacterium]